MGSTRTNMISLMAAALFVASGMLAAHADEAAKDQHDYAATTHAINFPGFITVSEAALVHREGRLVSLNAFNEMAKDENTIILDTRSAAAFAEGHISGAINLTFADLTELKLADTVPSRRTRILIYCDHNFSETAASTHTLAPQMALNVPTFINLYGHGYVDVYELGEQVSFDDARLAWEAPEILLAANETLIPVN